MDKKMSMVLKNEAEWLPVPADCNPRDELLKHLSAEAIELARDVNPDTPKEANMEIHFANGYGAWIRSITVLERGWHTLNQKPFDHCAIYDITIMRNGYHLERITVNGDDYCATDEHMHAPQVAKFLEIIRNL